MKRTFLLILAALITASSVGCQKSVNDPGTANAPGNADVSATAGETVESAEPVPQLPKKDYDGYVFRIYNADYMLSEGMNGAVLNDAIYQANEEVSSQFNISFENIQGGGMDSTVITQSIASQDNAFDLINFHDCTTASLALEGVFLDVNEMPYVDSSASWWPKHIVESLSHNGKMYYFSNYSSYTPMYATEATFFNKTLIGNYNLENPYAVVRNGEWTIDKIAELSKAVYTDTNGSGTADDGDTFGFIATNFPYRWLESFGVEAYTFENGTFSLNINNERTVDMVSKLNSWLYAGNPAIWCNFSEFSINEWTTFTQGNAAFVFAPIGALAPMMMDTDIDFGILPMPKSDSSQKTYLCGMNSELLSVPITTEDEERTGIIIEAMSYAGYKEIIPAYIQNTLQARYTTDTDSVEMLDLIFENQVLSFAYLFANSVPDGMQFRLIFDTVPSNNFASWYEANEKKELKMLETLDEFYNPTGD